MPTRLSPEMMALRVASELRRGEVVNLGIGLPTIVADYIPKERGVILHSENGILGFGPHAEEGLQNENLINARGEHITLFPGAVSLSHNDAFSIVRSGNLDVAVLGALQVSQRGDLSNWMVPDMGIGSPGGALDIAAAAKRLIVIMRHNTSDGKLKILEHCSYPLTVSGRVNRIITDIAVLDVTSEGLLIKELAPGWAPETVQELTGATLNVSSDLKEMDFSFVDEPHCAKIYPNAAAAVYDVFDGAVVLMDGFGGLGGMAHSLMLALRDHGAKELTIVSNTAGIARVSAFGAPPSPNLQAIDHSVLVENGQIKKAIASFPVSPSPSRTSAFEEAYNRGEVELEIVPQGTLAERLRAGGSGVAAIYTPTGVGTMAANGKEIRVINGLEYILERAIKGDFAFIRADKADTLGNLIYKGTSRNFNAVMARAADVTIVEVDDIVEPGELHPDSIITPGIYVNRIVQRPPGFSPFLPVHEAGPYA